MRELKITGFPTILGLKRNGYSDLILMISYLRVRPGSIIVTNRERASPLSCVKLISTRVAIIEVSMISKAHSKSIL